MGQFLIGLAKTREFKNKTPKNPVKKILKKKIKTHRKKPKKKLLEKVEDLIQLSF